MKYLSLTPATDWFFVHKSEDARRPHAIHRIAVWAITENGEVIGLIPVNDPRVTNGLTAKLVAPPPIEGEYRHLSTFTPDMREHM